eukprot:1857792-Heterocapsa_arctica.AAC.1
MTRVLCTTTVGIETNNAGAFLLRLNICLKLRFVQHDKRSARNIMVIASRLRKLRPSRLGKLRLRI